MLHKHVVLYLVISCVFCDNRGSHLCAILSLCLPCLHSVSKVKLACDCDQLPWSTRGVRDGGVVYSVVNVQERGRAGSGRTVLQGGLRMCG